MPKKNQALSIQNDPSDLRVNLTLHDVSAGLIAEFAEKIVQPYFKGNINAAIQDLMHKALAEQDLVLSHIIQLRNAGNP